MIFLQFCNSNFSYKFSIAVIGKVEIICNNKIAQTGFITIKLHGKFQATLEGFPERKDYKVLREQLL